MSIYCALMLKKKKPYLEILEMNLLMSEDTEQVQCQLTKTPQRDEEKCRQMDRQMAFQLYIVDSM